MATVDRIPVVNFQRYMEGGGRDNPVVKALHEAFINVGFVFLTNTGIDPILVEHAFKAADDFFTLPDDIKLKYKVVNGNNGYIPYCYQKVNMSQPKDPLEKYVIHDVTNTAPNIPSEEVPSFWPVVLELFEACSNLTCQVMEAMAYGLKLEDPHFFDKTVKPFLGAGLEQTFTSLRFQYYKPDSELEPGQLRLADHVDYGCVTLLFTDQISGLQVKRRDGGYIDAPYIPNAVIVNLGALMQRWTADIYLANEHRVVVPTIDTERKSARRSIALFVHPGRNVQVECLDGSEKYAPILAEEDTKRRFNVEYDNPKDYVV